ncbi:MAG: hypothetical protein AB7I19_01290 [Planctomycetota bacterium]
MPSPFGTLLGGPGATALIVPVGVPFTLPIPLDSRLVGASLSAQGASIDVQTLALTNALDITLGTR